MLKSCAAVVSCHFTPLLYHTLNGKMGQRCYLQTTKSFEYEHIRPRGTEKHIAVHLVFRQKEQKMLKCSRIALVKTENRFALQSYELTLSGSGLYSVG